MRKTKKNGGFIEGEFNALGGGRGGGGGEDRKGTAESLSQSSHSFLRKPHFGMRP